MPPSSPPAAVRKTGPAAYMRLCVVSTAAAQRLLRPGLRARAVLPGVSYYVVAVFDYATVADLTPGNERWRWAGGDALKECLVCVPLADGDGGGPRPNTNYVYRLYTSHPPIVEWAAKYGLHQDGAAITAATDGRRVRFGAVPERAPPPCESVAVAGARLCALPAWVWRAPLLARLLKAHFLFEEVGGASALWSFQGVMTFATSALAVTWDLMRGRGSAADARLPRAWASMSCVFSDFEMVLGSLEEAEGGNKC